MTEPKMCDVCRKAPAFHYTWDAAMTDPEGME